ncbi:hypothetical protein AcW1_009659 [Taiwanofungus camphoratus]|nr:hypothetical protein AcW1_009659 [Antrodia cinnamomea]
MARTEWPTLAAHTLLDFSKFARFASLRNACPEFPHRVQENETPKMKRLCRDQPAFGCAARKSDPGKRPVWGSPRRFQKRKYPHPRLWSLPLVLNDHKYVPPRDHLFSDFQPSSSLQTTHSNTATMDPVPAPALFNLTGQNVLITGASRGIGAACAIALAEAGANICLVQRPASPTHSDTYNAIAALGRTVKVVECDLADLESVKLVFERALDAMGGEIHVLVNCAGIQRRSPAVQFTEGDWDDVINVNLKSVWLLSQAAGQHMVPRRRGKIINFCSLLTFQGGFTVPAYAAAKGALGQLTKALSNEWSKENVQVNGICPGYIATQMNEKLLQDPVRLRQISERIPAGRWGEPRDFAGPVVFLASKASQYVCGELLVVDGGWMGR